VDYFLNKNKYDKGSTPTEVVNIWAVAGVIVGALTANFLKWGIASINAMVVAIVLYLIGNALKKKA